MHLKILFPAILPLLLLVAPSAKAQDHDHDHDHDHDDSAHPFTGETAYYLAEHGDFEIGLEDGGLALHFHLHAGTIVDGESLVEDTEFEPSQLIVVATHEAKQLRPTGGIWRATGADANEPLWVLPQHECEGLPALGVSTAGIEIGALVEDTICLELRYCDGPGEVSLWADDAFGQPAFLLSTHHQELLALLPAGLHAHYNWGFSKPGTYTLVFEASGNLATGGPTRTLAVYTFLVTDGPVLLHKPTADLNSDGIVDETDLQLVQDQLGQTALVWPPSGQDGPEQEAIDLH